jgi:hypothetical protein
MDCSQYILRPVEIIAIDLARKQNLDIRIYQQDCCNARKEYKLEWLVSANVPGEA